MKCPDGDHPILPAQQAGQTRPNQQQQPPQKPQHVDNDAIPAAVYRFDFGGNSSRYGVTNHYRAAMTAYAVVGGRPSGQPWEHIEDFRITKSDPLADGQSRLAEGIWNGFTYPRGLRVVAAVFSDGTSHGDRHVIDRIMARRKEELFTFGKMFLSICSMTKEHEAASAILTSLAKKKGEYVHTSGDRYVSKGGEDAYTAVMRGLSGEVNGGTPELGRVTLTSVEQLSRQLQLDPARDANGKLYLAGGETPTPCRLP